MKIRKFLFKQDFIENHSICILLCMKAYLIKSTVSLEKSASQAFGNILGPKWLKLSTAEVEIIRFALCCCYICRGLCLFSLCAWRNLFVILFFHFGKSCCQMVIDADVSERVLLFDPTHFPFFPRRLVFIKYIYHEYSF